MPLYKQLLLHCKNHCYLFSFSNSSVMQYNMSFNLMRCIFLLSCLLAFDVCFGRSLTEESNNAEKVPVKLFYEALCPGCQQFVLQGLTPMFKNGLIDIVDLELVPWGNARISPNQSFVCQHGPPECFLNTVEACAIDAWPTTSTHFPFINCVENLAFEGKHDQWETCFTKLGLDPKLVKDCSSGQHGTELERKYATETSALNPPHEFVPWIVVNGQPVREDIGNFITYICKAYKGTPPSACLGKYSDSSLTQQTPHGYPICSATQVHNDVPS